MTACKSFSLYECALDAAWARHAPIHERNGQVDGREGLGSLVRFRAQVAGMLSWCCFHEKKLIADRANQVQVHAGFERLSRIGPVAHRYRQIAQIAEPLVLYGEPDAPPAVTARYVDLHEGPLRREWFLLISARTYGVLLAAKDCDGFESNKPLRQRNFEAFATQDPELVRVVLQQLLQAFPSAMHVVD